MSLSCLSSFAAARQVAGRSGRHIRPLLIGPSNRFISDPHPTPLPRSTICRSVALARAFTSPSHRSSTSAGNACLRVASIKAIARGVLAERSNPIAARRCSAANGWRAAHGVTADCAPSAASSLRTRVPLAKSPLLRTDSIGSGWSERPHSAQNNANCSCRPLRSRKRIPMPIRRTGLPPRTCAAPSSRL